MVAFPSRCAYGHATLADRLVTNRARLRRARRHRFTVNTLAVCNSRSGVRTGFAYLVVLVVIAAYGVVTWPPKPAPTLPLQVVSLPTSAVNPPATPNGILPPKAVVPSLPSPTEPPKPQPKPKPEAKPNPKPPSKAPREELYPIVFVSETHVARNADAHHITIDISFSNTTNTEANAHISVEGVITVNGSDAGILSPASRDVGLAPPPYHYQLSTDVPLTPEADALYMNGSAVITMNGQVSYPDRGSTTIYRFKGVTNPKLDHLDLIQSEWEHSP